MQRYSNIVHTLFIHSLVSLTSQRAMFHWWGPAQGSGWPWRRESARLQRLWSSWWRNGGWCPGALEAGRWGRQGRQAGEAAAPQWCRFAWTPKRSCQERLHYKEEEGQKVPLADGEEDGEDKRDVMEKKSGRGLSVKGGNPASYTAADYFIRTAMKRRVHRLPKYHVQ